MPPPDPAAVLLGKASQDARLAAKLKDDTSVSDEHVGFFCQQAVEKAIKSVLSRRRVRYRRTHDLQELVDLLKASDIDGPAELAESPSLTPFAVEFRYDDLAPERNSLDVFDRTEAARIAMVMVEWAQRIAQGG